MKHDPYFKYLAVLILAGVILAIVDPAPDAALPAKVPSIATTPPRGLTAKS